MTSHSTNSFSISATHVKNFDEKGFVVIEGLLGPEEVQRYQSLYDQFLRGEIQCDQKRSDLGGHLPQRKQGSENVTQIMWPIRKRDGPQSTQREVPGRTGRKVGGTRLPVRALKSTKAADPGV